MKNKITYLFIFLFLITTPSFASIKINEIYPAPATGEKEWVELYNSSNVQIGISGFYLNDLAQNKIYLETNFIDPYGFIIGSCSNILNNMGDTVFLKNYLNEIIDTATYSATFTSEKTYARCPNGADNWYILSLATKNYSNETACPTPTSLPTQIPTLTPTIIIPTESPTPTIQPSITPSPTSEVDFEKIYLSEAMVYPETGSNEWIEIYNDNDFSINLVDWYLDDLENAGSTPKKISLEISAKNYQIIELTSAMFNNDGDQVRLLDFEKKEKDSFEYEKGEKNKTWGRKDLINNEFCQQEPSKEKFNSDCLNPTNTPTSKPTNSLNNQTSITNVPILSGISPTKKNQTYLPNIKYPISNISDSNILGTSTTQTIIPKKNNSAINSLSFLSFSYSLLTIFSILFRMK